MTHTSTKERYLMRRVQQAKTRAGRKKARAAYKAHVEETAHVTVKVDGVPVIPVSIDDEARVVTLAEPPPEGSTVTVVSSTKRGAQ